MKTDRSKLIAAVCLLLCAAIGASALVSCGRRRRVVPSTTTTAETTDDAAGSDTDGGDTERDSDHVIVIDPGHGFGDTGFTSRYTAATEADVDLSFSISLRDVLEERGYTVYLTHEGETFPQTEADNGDEVYGDRERASYANEHDAEYFISVHCNYYGGDGAEDVSGSRVYVSASAKAGKAAVRQAGELLSSALGGKRLGDDQSTLFVTPEYDSYKITTLADGASLLLMLGYMTNERDVMNMIDPAWIARTAASAADAIDAYFAAG